MNNNENISWREIVAGFSSYEGTLGNFCNANHITKSQFYYYKRKYIYKVNFFIATHMCRKFYYGKTTSPNLEPIIAENIIQIRPDRHR